MILTTVILHFLDNSNVDIFRNLEIVEKNDKEYLSPISFNTSMTVSKPRVHFDGLFDGNKEIGLYLFFNKDN